MHWQHLVIFSMEHFQLHICPIQIFIIALPNLFPPAKEEIASRAEDPGIKIQFVIKLFCVQFFNAGAMEDQEVHAHITVEEQDNHSRSNKKCQEGI